MAKGGRPAGSMPTGKDYINTNQYSSFKCTRCDGTGETGIFFKTTCSKCGGNGNNPDYITPCSRCGSRSGCTCENW
jgi:DnaJ-class molecular chaperone